MDPVLGVSPTPFPSPHLADFRRFLSVFSCRALSGLINKGARSCQKVFARAGLGIFADRFERRPWGLPSGAREAASHTSPGAILVPAICFVGRPQGREAEEQTKESEKPPS